MIKNAPVDSSGVIKTNVLRLSLLAIISVFIFEFSAGIATNSLALTTDSLHALFDAAVTGILLVATRLALKPRDTEHTYGHGKIETIGGFVGGIILFIIATFFIYESISRISNPGVYEIKIGAVGFIAIIYTLLIDGLRISLLHRAAKKTESSTIKSDYYHAFTDLLSTGTALAGLWLVTLGFLHGDSIAAIILGAFLAYLSSRFVYNNALELTDAISPNLVSRVRETTHNTPGVLECRDIKMRKVGSEIFIEVTIALRANISFESAHTISAEVERNIMQNIGGKPHITIHFEPIWTKDLPAESLIEKAALDVNGVRGVHNISVARVASSNTVYASLHIQVERSASLDQAHSIANMVEENVKEYLTGIKHVTVHLEPLMPPFSALKQVSDKEIEHSVKMILGKRYEIKETREIMIYRTDENRLKIDINCIFNASKDTNIDKIHQQVSEIEKDIRARYTDAIVTIHSEPEL